MIEPFDRTKAEAGVVVECKVLDTWINVEYIGVTFGGGVVIRVAHGNKKSDLSYVNPEMLRINTERINTNTVKPQPVNGTKGYWIQCYKGNTGGQIVCTNPRETRNEAIAAADPTGLIDEPKMVTLKVWK